MHLSDRLRLPAHGVPGHCFLPAAGPARILSNPTDPSTGEASLSRRWLSNILRPRLPTSKIPPHARKPFHRPMLMNQQTNTPFVPATKPANTRQPPATRQPYNPFLCRPPRPASSSLFQAQPTRQLVAISDPIQPLETGADSFAGNFGLAQPDQPTQPQRPAEINTNLFRPGAFVNHDSGMGWQHNQQPKWRQAGPAADSPSPSFLATSRSDALATDR